MNKLYEGGKKQPKMKDSEKLTLSSRSLNYYCVLKNNSRLIYSLSFLELSGTIMLRFDYQSARTCLNSVISLLLFSLWLTSLLGLLKISNVDDGIFLSRFKFFSKFEPFVLI